MIVYRNEFFGILCLLRVHGSAVYKTLLPALLSTAITLAIHYTAWIEEDVVGHPYSIGAFVGFFSFLLTFRLNYGYQRYWEGASAVHVMMSKWQDVAMCLAAFHYQSRAYDDIRPPTFGSRPEATDSTVEGRHRNFYNSSDSISLEASSRRPSSSSEGEETDRPGRFRRRKRNQLQRNQSRRASHESLATLAMKLEVQTEKGKSINSHDPTDVVRRRIPIPQRFQEQFTLQQHRNPNDKDQASPQNISRQKLVKQQHYHNLIKQRQARVPLPSLFLQELAHLLSLLSAVALSTLRNDIENAESPLTEYIPGKPWPPVDPDALSQSIKEEYDEGNVFWRSLYFCLGLSRSPYRRTLYNAARPFAVLGGVSDDEIRLLQRARGPNAKVAICSMWTQEFISREYLNGSTGKVAPPILSRLYQFLSDGVAGYNQARKVAYVDFPFAHAQATAFFTVAVIFIFPWLYATKVNIVWFAALLDGVTVICFLGLHEVARELEDPFFNAPNDLPLTTFQAQFNEALVTMYAGYHPDSWWDLKTGDEGSPSRTPPVASAAPLFMPPSVAAIPENASLPDDEPYLEFVGSDRNDSFDGT